MYRLLVALGLFLALSARAEEGMWTYDAFPSEAVKRAYGFAPTQSWLDSIRLASVRLAGGCSASFVSPNGLVMTNHHGGRDSIQKLSTKDKDYQRDGFYFPYDAISEAEAAEILADLEAAEADVAANREELSLLRSYPARLLPSFDRLIRHPRLIDAVSELLGPDLLVWGSGLFIKEPNTTSYVSW